MSIEEVIREEASKIAAREHSRASHLYEEYKRVQAQAERLKADHDLARSAPDRLLSFQAMVNGDYQCPACWIEQNAGATMLPVPAPPKTTFWNASNAAIGLLLRTDV